MNEKLVIFGAAKLAEMAHFYFSRDSGYRVAAFTVDVEYAQSGEFLGLPLVPFEDVQERYPPDGHDLFVAVGYRDLNRLRHEKCSAARAKGYALARYLSSKAAIWDDPSIGENSMVQEGCTVQPFVTIGQGVILFCGCQISHDVAIENFCYFAPGALVCGGARIGERSFVGSGAVVRDGVRIGERNIIGAGCRIMENTSAGAVYVGEKTKPFFLDADQFLKKKDI